MAEERAALTRVAEQVRAAFATKDLSTFGALLADDARWGDDDHPNRCRSRSDVLATFDRWIGAGVDGEVTETATGPNGVMCRLRIHRVDAEDRGRGQAFFHVYKVRDGRIAEIRRYDDRASALEAIGA